jgi:hypothetical protein
MMSYPNVERRSRHSTQYPAATHRGWDAKGRFHFIGKGRVRGDLWWAVARDDPDKTALYGTSLREISEALAAKKQRYREASASPFVSREL